MTLAARLLALIVLALLPPLAIQAWVAIEQRQEQAAGLRTEALAHSRAVQAEMGSMANSIRRLLVAIAEQPSIRGGDSAGCNAYLHEVTEQIRDFILLAANDTEGSILCSSLGAAPGSYSNAARAYHRRAMATGAFAVGDLVTGVATARRSIHFALPFRRLDGQVGGIVLASVDQSKLEEQLAAEALPRGAIGLLIDPAGTVVVAVRDGAAAPGWAGQPVAAAIRTAFASHTPQTLQVIGPNGNPRLFGIVPPDPLLGGATVTVGLDGARALAELSRGSWRMAAGLMLGAVLALAVGIAGSRRFVLAPIARLVDAAERVGRGELGARSNLGRRSAELREVGAAFDRMSTALAARESERDRAEAARSLGEERYRTLFEAIDAGFCIVELRYDADGRAADYRFLEVNPAFEALTGLHQAKGRWMREMVPTLEQHWFDTYAAVARSGEPARFENVAEALGRWYEVHAFRVDEPALHRVAILFNDVSARRKAELALRTANETLEARVAERTAELHQVVEALHAEARDRAQAEAQLRQSQKMEAVGQLTGGIAHDFNNMLQAISGSLELMQRRIEQGRAPEASRHVAAARATVTRAAALTHRLLAFARRQALEPTAVRPDTLVDGMAELVRRAVGPGVTLQLQLHAEDAVLCDPNQLENVLLNLAINARDAMPAGGTLTIVTRSVQLTERDTEDHEGAAAGDYVEIAVSDTGTGMDEATRLRAFEPFFTTKPIGAGSGLGLSQVYGFVRQSGGAIRLDSAPGQGTTVRVFLPRTGAKAADVGESAAPAGPVGASGTVLLVEDEAPVRAGTAEHLRDRGLLVLEAADGPAALLLLRNGARPDVLVTDVGLPGLNGRQVADAAREIMPGLPVIFITGYAGGALAEALPAGMLVIAKPFALDALSARLDGLLKPVG